MTVNLVDNLICKMLTRQTEVDIARDYTDTLI